MSVRDVSIFHGFARSFPIMYNQVDLGGTFTVSCSAPLFTRYGKLAQPDRSFGISPLSPAIRIIFLVPATAHKLFCTLCKKHYMARMLPTFSITQAAPVRYWAPQHPRKSAGFEDAHPLAEIFSCLQNQLAAGPTDQNYGVCWMELSQSERTVKVWSSLMSSFFSLCPCKENIMLP